MFLSPKNIVYFFKNGYFTSLQNLVPASNALKSNMAANAEFQDLAASVHRLSLTASFDKHE